MKTRFLTKYINRIEYSLGDSTFTFYGDGMGDFEEIADAVENDNLIINYINDCEQQIYLAKTYMLINEK